jgi:hypothetical protein
MKEKKIFKKGGGETFEGKVRKNRVRKVLNKDEIEYVTK